ncbi:MAG: AMMECR1 domain-containing protein [Pseudomonadales bacterium]|nr:AMMECR1 domain-containing protein [Pseudomonadales bacterium]
MNLSEQDKQTLIDLAWQSIRCGLQTGHPLQKLGPMPPGLMVPGASFVTLESNGNLRGCIGSLQAHQPLAEDVVHNAYSAAFRDSRFMPLQADELAGLSLQVSVLTEPTDLSFRDEADLLQQLVPGEDGIILEDGYHRATFLPQVWNQLPQPDLFMTHLKNKAGLPSNYWSEDIRIQRYHVEKFG